MKPKRPICLGLLLFILATHISGAQHGLFTYEDRGEYIEITDYPENATGTVTIPSTINDKAVRSIGWRTFFNCSSIEAVTFPDTIENIGSGAFQYCSSITSITLPDGLTSIEGDTFSECTSLTSIQLPDTITHIGQLAFFKCVALSEISMPKALQSIDMGAFGNCISLESIILPEGFKTIGNQAFNYCTSLTSVSLPSSLQTLERGAFSACTALESINLPPNVTSVPDQLFSGCWRLSDVAVEGQLTAIGDEAFMGTSLSDFDLSSILTIGNSAFSECNFTFLSLPDTLVSIGRFAFSRNNWLESLSLPENVSIGMGAFRYCENLNSVTFKGDIPTLWDITFEGHAEQAILRYPETATGVDQAALDSFIKEPIAPSYEEWLRQFFSDDEILNLELSDKNADADGDGHSNVFEYYARLDPRDINSRLSFKRNENHRSMFTFSPVHDRFPHSLQTSEDLESWETIPYDQYQVIDSAIHVDLSILSGKLFLRISFPEPPEEKQPHQ